MEQTGLYIMRPKIGFKPVPLLGGDQRKQPKAKWDGGPMRCPKKGEYYLSGAIVEAYKAKNDMTTLYFIAVKI